jgi:hypothetical protein
VGSRRTKSRPKLSVEQTTKICRALVAIGDEAFRYADRLNDAGYHAFSPRWKFAESFCATQEESELHRKCVIEEAKYLVGWPWPPLHARWTEEERTALYASPLFARLRAERDKENGVPESELARRYPTESGWRREIDPCRRRRALEEVNARSVYDERWTSMLEEERRLFEQEVAQHSSKLARAHTFDEAGRYAFFAAAMERDATPLGFRYDKPKSQLNYPVFSKMIARDWDICCSLEEPRMFFRNPFEGRFTPFLALRGRTLRGRADNAQPGEFLQIRYAGVVPGFFGAYMTYHGLDELETMIKAHLCLYGLMAPIIEGGLKEAFGDESAETAS